MKDISVYNALGTTVTSQSEKMFVHSGFENLKIEISRKSIRRKRVPQFGGSGDKRSLIVQSSASFQLNSERVGDRRRSSCPSMNCQWWK